MKIGKNIVILSLVVDCLFVAGVYMAESTCDKWSSIAKMMSGDGRYHTCANNKTDTCTRFDCQGSLFENIFSHALEVDYCFGIQINSCLEPLSMDFYLNIPSHNFSNQYRITHDQIVYLPMQEGFFKELKDIPLVKELELRPLLDFEFERDGQDNVLISITLELKSRLPMLFDQFKRSIVNEEKLPIDHCNKLTQDETKEPAKNFESSVLCHTDKYPAMQPRVIRPPENSTPSDTLNKTCGFDKGCSQGETCEMTSDTEGRCQCEPDYRYVASNQVCVSRGSAGLECLSPADCGVYEECVQTTQDVSPSQHTCQCEDGYRWNDQRKLCILDSSPSGSASKGKPYIIPSTMTNSSATHSVPDQPDGHKAASANTKYMVIGGAAVGAVIVVAAVVVGLLVCRRRRRNRYPDGAGLYDSHSPMLVDVNDDVDLVM